MALVRAVLGGLIALAFVGFVHWYVGWVKLLRPWRELPPAAVLLPACLFLLTYGLRALRLHDHFGGVVHNQRAACLRLVLRHNLFNNLLPMRTGELAFPMLMARRFDIAAGDSVPALLWFRVLDLHSVLLFAGPALVLPFGWTPWIVPAIVVWLAGPWIFHRVFCRVLRRPGRDVATALGAGTPGIAGRMLERVLRGVPLQSSAFWRTYAWTLASWSLKLAVFAWVLMLFAPIEPMQALLGAIGGELTSILPVHGVAGMGTYEAGVLAALAPAGGNPAQLVRAAVNLHLFLLGVTLVGGGLAWLPAGRRAVAGETRAGEGDRR